MMKTNVTVRIREELTSDGVTEVVEREATAEVLEGETREDVVGKLIKVLGEPR